ncbi:MAG TPA: hypothetical protein VNC59_09205, partial [Thermoanaerobaculia bacterium]|nr:hypothetical protein [Thermoanaerobaculia bacterium]
MMRFAPIARASLIVLSFALVSATFVSAQSTTGSISGTVADTSGGAVANVTITVRNVNTSLARSAT